jgi:hypothetical protein
MRCVRAVLVVFVSSVGLAVGCSNGSADLLGVAEAFTAPAPWVELEASESTEPLCFGAGCTTIVVRWSSDQTPDAELLTDAVDAAGWKDIAVDDCAPKTNVTGPVPFCELTATDDSAEIVLRASGPVAGKRPWEIVLLVS